MSVLYRFDWETVLAAGKKSVPPGPKLSLNQAKKTVKNLNQTACQAAEKISQVSGLPVSNQADIFIVTRSGWVEHMVQTMQEIIGSNPAAGTFSRLATKFTSTQVGLAIGGLSVRVLGQFDPYGVSDKLLLVGPNIVRVQQKIEVDPKHFQMWVCLHEQTHQAQFNAAPWLVQHLLEIIAELLAGNFSRFDQAMATMSLLEGHADYTMDIAGAKVIPDVEEIRKKFNQYRHRSGMAWLLNKVSGMDQKLTQYRQGAKFCREVVQKVGVEGLNHAFESRENLPTRDEIRNPVDWVTRVVD